MLSLRGPPHSRCGPRVDIRPAHVASPRPSPGPAVDSRPSGRREMARGWPRAQGRPEGTRPQCPLSRHTWAGTWPARPAARAFVRPPTETPGNPGGLARRPHPRQTHIPGPGSPGAGHHSTTGRGGAKPRPGHAPGLGCLRRSGAPSGSAPPRSRLRHRGIESHAGSSCRKEATPSTPSKRAVPPSADKYPVDSRMSMEGHIR